MKQHELTTTYFEQVKDSIIDYFFDNYTEEYLKERCLNCYEELFEQLYDELWTVDSVTGNASGSWTFSRWHAQMMVQNNLPTVISACQEFGIEPSTFGTKVLEEEWEYLDVTARCYVLYDALDALLKELMEVWAKGQFAWLAWF